MSATLQKPAVAAVDIPLMAVHLQPGVIVSDDQLYDLARRNSDWRIERDKNGEVTIMPPCGGGTSDRNSELNMQLRLWAKVDRRGKAFDSSGGFVLPNGAMRSPDAAWATLARLDTLTDEQREEFMPLCPEFVVELRSRTDTLRALLDKMREYMENGTRLGWLIDPQKKRVYVFCPNQEPRILENPASVAADEPLTGFVLDLREIW